MHIPTLNVYFLGEERDGIFLTPIIVDPRFDLAPGKAISAEDVFRILQPATEGMGDFPT